MLNLVVVNFHQASARLPSCKASSPPVAQYQIILLGDLLAQLRNNAMAESETNDIFIASHTPPSLHEQHM